MKKLNFNQLKSVKTPEEWIEKAINIPNTKNKVFRPSKLTISVIAASFVCICSVSLFIAMHFSHSVANVPAILTEGSSSRQESGITDASMPSQNEDNTYSSLFFANPSAMPTGADLFADSTVNSVSQSGEHSTRPGRSKPTVHNGASAIATEPHETTPESTASKSTQPSAVKPTSPIVTEKPEPTKPTVATVATVAPTTDSYSNQTEPCDPDSSSPPESPGDPYIAEETPPGYASVYYPMIHYHINENSVFSLNDTLYCHISSFYGKEYTERFSNDELCVKRNGGFEYSTVSHGISLEKGYYHFQFYNQNNVTYTTLLYVNSDYLYIGE